MSGLECNKIAGVNRSIIVDDDRGWVSMFDVYGDAIEVVAVLLEYEPIHPIFNDGIDWEYDLFVPDFDGDL
jgi:hypothetical protein